MEDRLAGGVGVHDDGVTFVLGDGPEGVNDGVGGSENVVVFDAVDKKCGDRPSGGVQIGTVQ